MLTKYIDAAMKSAKYEIVEEDGTFYASIPGLQGLWASDSTLEGCREELRSVLEGWIIVMLRRNQPLPSFGRASLGRPLDKTA
jgi:predicted RNase H-like HicB family nuclease